MKMPRRLFSIFCLVFVFGSCVRLTKAADLIIAENGSKTITGTTIHLAADTYDNKGTLTVAGDGGLNIGTGTTNPGTPEEGYEGIDLGIVLNSGTVESAQTIHFQGGSKLGGTVVSQKDIVFDEAVTTTGALTAKTLIIAAPERDEDGKVIGTAGTSVIDLQGASSALNVDQLLVNGLAEIKVKSGETLVLDELVLGASGAILGVSGDLVVEGNFRSEAGTGLNIAQNSSGVGLGTVTLKGGGTETNGANNVIWQSKINAGKVRVENKTYIVNNLLIQGDLELAADSTTKADNGIVTGGRLKMEEGSKLRLMGDSYSTMREFGYQRYNGIFAGGFELQSGSVLETAGSGQLLYLAIGASSSIAGDSGSLDAAKITGGNILMTGTNSYGTYTLQTVTNSGSIAATKSLELIAVNLAEKDAGTLAFNSLKMTNNSVIDFRSSSLSNGGLTVTGEGGTVDIGVNSKILATGKTINFGGAAVINRNTEGGIQGGMIQIGKGGSYTGTGLAQADATFQSGGTLILTPESHVDFGSGNVLMTSGSRIELNIKSGYLGTLKTEGQIIVKEGVKLAVANGSSFSGRTSVFEIARGNKDSRYEGLDFEKSLFFEMTGAWRHENSLVVEILKVADLVDYAKSSNQRNLGLVIDQMILDKAVSEKQAVVFDALMLLPSDESYCSGLDDLSGSVRENAVLFALSSPWRVPLENIGFQRLSLALENKKTSKSSDGSIVNGQSRFPTVKMPSVKLPRWNRAHDLWFNGFYHYADISSDGNTKGGDGHRGGFFMGSALPTASRESLFGISFGYSGGEYKQDSGKIELNDYRIGLYGGANLWKRNLQIRGYLGYGFQDYRQNRHVQIGDEGPFLASGKPNGNSTSAAILLIRPVDLSERFLLKPTVGFDFERLEQDGFLEDGDAEIALRYGDTTLTRTMLRLGFSSDYSFNRFDLSGRFLYGFKVSGDDAAVSRHSFGYMPNYGFDIASVDIGSHVFDIGLGGVFGLNTTKSSLLFLDYNGSFTEHSGSHTGSFGFLWKH